MGVKVLLVTNEDMRFSRLTDHLKEQRQMETVLVRSGEQALRVLESVVPAMLLVDEELDDMSGLELVRRVVKVNPFVGVALASRLDPEAFHEATEGLGVFWQLPLAPQSGDAVAMLATFDRINGLLAPEQGAQVEP